mmetsp:Transcript_1248/g.3167  ORF Transcript_1248/g.3167 Transcript_1248/m.3167 type:complete len:256 (-) Transcript_1248:405-1172(-)
MCNVSKLQLWSEANVTSVLETNPLVIEHLVDILVGWALLGASALDEIGTSVVLSKDIPVGIESLHQPHIPTSADIALHDVDVFKSHFVQSSQRVSLATQKRCELSKDAILLRSRIQGVVHNSPLGVDQSYHSFSGLAGNAVYTVDGFLAGLNKARNIVRCRGTLCEPQTNPVDTALVEGSVFLQSRDYSSLGISRITAQDFLASKGCSTIQLHDSTLPGLVWGDQNGINVDRWIGICNAFFEILSKLVVVRTPGQ